MFCSLQCGMVYPQNLQIAHIKEKYIKKDKFEIYNVLKVRVPTQKPYSYHCNIILAQVIFPLP